MKINSLSIILASIRRRALTMVLFLRKHWILTTIFIISVIVYSTISILRHIHFGSAGYDLTIFDQAVHNYSRFQAPASSFRGFENLLGDHFHPILALLAPLY